MLTRLTRPLFFTCARTADYVEYGTCTFFPPLYSYISILPPTCRKITKMTADLWPTKTPKLWHRPRHLGGHVAKVFLAIWTCGMRILWNQHQNDGTKLPLEHGRNYVHPQ